MDHGARHFIERDLPELVDCRAAASTHRRAWRLATAAVGMMASYTAAQQAEALEHAVRAVRAFRDGEGNYEEASAAVTVAVLAYDITPRQIAVISGAPGLAVINLIERDNAEQETPTVRDLALNAARTTALRMERHAADRYRDEVLEAIRAEAVWRIDVLGDTEAAVARDLGINRDSVRKWQGKS